MYKYIGAGSYIAGIPRRDLTDREAKQYGEQRLIASGLYQAPKRSYKQTARVDPEAEQEIDNNG